MSGRIKFAARVCMTLQLFARIASASAAGTHSEFVLPEWPSNAISPAFSLRDVEGRMRTLADYRGSAVVVYFGFLHCPDACPAELYKLSLSLKKLGRDARRVQVLFITLDPDRDSVPMLRNYVANFGPRIAALTGSVREINRAAASFRVEFARVPQEDGYTIDHSDSTFIFDRAGRLRLVGTPESTSASVAHDLALLAADR